MITRFFVLVKFARVNETQAPVAYGLALFSKISNGFFFSSDESSDFKKLRYYDLDKDMVTIELTKHIDWEVTYFLDSYHARYFVQ